jgi:hypothetical protein
MRKIEMAFVAGVLAAFCLIVFISCEDKVICDCDNGEIPEYHLYNPNAEYIDRYTFVNYVHSTKTGEILRKDTTSLYIKQVLLPVDSASLILLGKEVGAENSTLLILDYKSGDTINKTEVNYEGGLFLSPDGNHLLYQNGYANHIYSIPSLQNILIDSAACIFGGFLENANKYYYFEGGIDSIRVVDFSDPQNLEKTSFQTNYYGRKLYPRYSEAHFGTRKIIIILENDARDITHIQVRKSDDLGFIKEVQTSRIYRTKPFISPNGDFALICCYDDYIQPGWMPGNYIDIYYMNYNIRMDYISEINTEYGFLPKLIEFTPDGQYAFIMRGGGGAKTEIIGIDIKSKQPIEYIPPYSGGALVIKVIPSN